MEVLVEFCLKVYFPSWFDIKLNSKITQAAINNFRMLKRIDQFPHKHARYIALSTLIRNGFSAHPENVILSIFADDYEIFVPKHLKLCRQSANLEEVN